MSSTAGPNIRALREARGLKAVEVARHLGLDRSAYSKTEKGLRNVTVDELRRAAQLFACSMDDVLDFDPSGAPPPAPAAPSLADADAREQARLIQELDPDDRRALHRILERMIASKRLHDFFDENVRTAA